MAKKCATMVSHDKMILRVNYREYRYMLKRINMSLKIILNKTGDFTIEKFSDWFTNAHEKKIIYINKFLKDKMIA